MIESFEEKKARIQEFRPIDDAFFEVLIRNRKVCEEILQTILEDPNLAVLEVVPQNSIRNLQGRSVRLDALCRLGTGKVCNVEVQRADNDDHFRRVRYNTSCITANVTDPGEKFRNIPDIIAIYISEHDFLKLGKTVYHVDKIIRETGSVVDDGLSEIFVNAQVNDGSDIAALMQCFHEREPDNPKFPEIQKEVYEIKHTEGGITTMCRIMDEYAKEYARESNIQVSIRMCKEFGQSINATIKKIVEMYSLSQDDAAKKVSQYWEN